MDRETNRLILWMLGVTCLSRCVYLLVNRLVSSCAFCGVSERNLDSVRTPGMRQDRIVRDIVIVLFHQARIPDPGK